MPKKKAECEINTRDAPGLPWIAVDPGAHTAVVVFLPSLPRPTILEVKSFNGGPGPWIMRAKRITLQFHNFIFHYEHKQDMIGAMFIEEPKAFSSVATHRGDQMKVDAVYGMLCATAFLFPPGMMIVPVGVNEWKGQLNKKQVESRVRSMMGWPHETRKHLPKNDHEWDALGIACYISKRWNKREGSLCE